MLLKKSFDADAEFTNRLRAAAKRGVSAEDLHAQRVSFIVSSVSDEKTNVTPQMVEAELKRLNGHAA